VKSLVRLIAPEARSLAILVAALAAVSGLLSAALVAIGNSAIHSVTDSESSAAGTLLIAAFAGAGLGRLISGYFSEVLLTKFCHSTIARIRTNLVQSILEVPLRTYENVGSPRVFACLTEDVAAVSQALSVLPGMVINAAIIIGAAGYLLWLSPAAFAILAIGAGSGFVIYRFLAKKAERHWSEARSSGDILHDHYKTFTAGVKELKMHAPRRHTFLNDSLAATADLYADQCVTATRRYTFAHSLSHGVFFILIGIMLFVLPRYGLLAEETLSGYVLTCLFLLGPVSGILYSIPAIVRARIAQEKITAIGVDLHSASRESNSEFAVLAPDWQSLSLTGATFTYRGEGSREFTAGPIDLRISRGELLFITGANGSGKTTLGKMLAGLYEPITGVFSMDSHTIDQSNRDAYRQHISTVFSDFHLFTDISASGSTSIDIKSARAYLAHLGLDDVVRLSDDGQFSTTTALSTGQRKRLALLTAYIDDRDIMIFDEWAADQDPEFRRFFYERLLPDLHHKGKTLIIITHDDRYFHCAQRLIKIADGQLHTIRQQEKPSSSRSGTHAIAI
jgi:putative ATP-binding cassette transporter